MQLDRTVKRAAQHARSAVREELSQRALALGEQVGTAGRQLRALAHEYRDRHDEPAALLAEGAAGGAERIATYLQRLDPESALHVALEFARRRPVAASVGGFVVGLTAARLIKAGAGGPSSNGASDAALH